VARPGVGRTRLGSNTFEGGGMRRQASPHHFTRQAKFVEQVGLVARDPPRQNLRFPRRRPESRIPEAASRFEALHPRRAVDCPGVRCLPNGGRKAHEIGGRDRLDFTAQAPYRQAMDARERMRLLHHSI